METISATQRDLQAEVDGIAAILEAKGVALFDPESAGEDGEGYIEPLDIRANVGTDGQLWSVRVTVAVGGPHIDIDTARGAVIGTWYSDKARRHLGDRTLCAINDYFAELFTGVTIKH